MRGLGLFTLCCSPEATDGLGRSGDLLFGSWTGLRGSKADCPTGFCQIRQDIRVETESSFLAEGQTSGHENCFGLAFQLSDDSSCLFLAEMIRLSLNGETETNISGDVVGSPPFRVDRADSEIALELGSATCSSQTELDFPTFSIHGLVNGRGASNRYGRRRSIGVLYCCRTGCRDSIGCCCSEWGCCPFSSSPYGRSEKKRCPEGQQRDATTTVHWPAVPPTSWMPSRDIEKTLPE